MKWGPLFYEISRHTNIGDLLTGLLIMVLIAAVIAAPVAGLLYLMSAHEKLESDEKKEKFIKIFVVSTGMVFLFLLLFTCE